MLCTALSARRTDVDFLANLLYRRLDFLYAKPGAVPCAALDKRKKK